MLKRTPQLLLIVGLLLASGCGGGASHLSSSTATTAGEAATAQPAGALSADARSAATGDTPDSQNFLELKAQRLHVAMVYPGGWAVKEGGSSVSIRDKNNLVRIAVSAGPVPTSNGSEEPLCRAR